MKAVDLPMEQKPRALVLAGPTASGKTALSIQVAKALNCEIVCMDSMQIYRGMDIGTAKPTREEMEGIPHHMLDVADPREAYSVAMYQQQAEQAMGDIVARGHTPLLVGGTGFYLRTLRNPMAMGGAGSDADIRAELENIAAEANGREKLHAMLAQVDADTAARLPVNDVRRVIRALEVFRLTGKPFSRQDIPQRECPAFLRQAVLRPPAAAGAGRPLFWGRVTPAAAAPPPGSAEPPGWSASGSRCPAPRTGAALPPPARG